MFGLILSELTMTATAQTVAVPENWIPTGRVSKTITGRVTFNR